MQHFQNVGVDKLTLKTNIQGCGIDSMDADDQMPRLDMFVYSTNAFTPAIIVHSVMRRARVNIWFLA